MSSLSSFFFTPKTKFCLNTPAAASREHRRELVSLLQTICYFQVCELSNSSLLTDMTTDSAHHQLDDITQGAGCNVLWQEELIARLRLAKLNNGP